MFTNCFTIAEVNGNRTKLIQLGRGLFQGSLWSPMLFNIYIDDLAEKLNRYRISTLFFADDILIQTNSVMTMQRHLRDVENWCESSLMKINVGKSGTVNNVEFLINGVPIPIIGSYQYLGIPLSLKGVEIESHIEKCGNKSLMC